MKVNYPRVKEIMKCSKADLRVLVQGIVFPLPA